MSATGRGTNRDPKDFYATPKAAFEPLLHYLPRDIPFWEPCAGDGRLVKWLHESGRDAGGAEPYSYPSTPDSWYQNHICFGLEWDYLKDDKARRFVITNPPFSLAFEMAQHAMKHSEEFMFLLRLSFLESDGRGDWLSANEPNGLWVLRKRPSFVMSVTCKSVVIIAGESAQCRHNWLLPIESERPKVCPKCGGDKLAISTSDNSGYAWFYWGNRPELRGIHHI